MVQLDPRKWHQSSLSNVHEANQNFIVLPLMGANLRAALTGTAALGTEAAVLLFKNTLIGSAGGILRVARLETNTPGWADWKISALKVMAYIKGVFLCLWAIPASIPSRNASFNNVLYHHQQILPVPEIEEGIRTLHTKRQAYDLNALQETVTNLVKDDSRILTAIKAVDHPRLTDLKRYQEELPPLIDSCTPIINAGHEILTLLDQWNYYLLPQEKGDLSTLGQSIRTLLQNVNNAKSALECCQKKVIKAQTEAVQHEELFFSRAQEVWKSKWDKVSLSIEPKQSYFQALQHYSSKLQEKKLELDHLQQQFDGYKHLIEAEHCVQQTQWFTDEEEALKKEASHIEGNIQTAELEKLNKHLQKTLAECKANYIKLFNLFESLYLVRNGELLIGPLYDALEKFRIETPAVYKELQISLNRLQKLKEAAQNLTKVEAGPVLQLLAEPAINPKLLSAFAHLSKAMDADASCASLWLDDDFRNGLEAAWKITNPAN